jgi:mannose-6-phosphate isomerase
MAIERACVNAFVKPWGIADLRPWSRAGHDGILIGELRYERSGAAAPEPQLMLKLLFTGEPLSIQVHPGDEYARSIGLPNGKTEAWYVLGATPGAKVALGLTRQLTPQQFREAVDGGSIAELVRWQDVSADDSFHVPAGTIHAIGAGLIIAEIQQRSDATFRLFDHGRKRELHVERAIAAAGAGPAEIQAAPSHLTDQRTLLVSNAHFVFERIALAAGTTWSLDAQRETWLLVIAGDGTAGPVSVSAGDAIFAQSDCISLSTGATGMVCLAAYTAGGQLPQLQQHLGNAHIPPAARQLEHTP